MGKCLCAWACTCHGAYMERYEGDFQGSVLSFYHVDYPGLNIGPQAWRQAFLIMELS